MTDPRLEVLPEEIAQAMVRTPVALGGFNPKPDRRFGTLSDLATSTLAELLGSAGTAETLANLLPIPNPPDVFMKPDELREAFGTQPSLMSVVGEVASPLPNELATGIAKLAPYLPEAKALLAGSVIGFTGRTRAMRARLQKQYDASTEKIANIDRSEINPAETNFQQSYGISHRNARAVNDGLLREMALELRGPMSIDKQQKFIDDFYKDRKNLDEMFDRRSSELTKQVSVSQEIDRFDAMEASEKLGFEINPTEWADEHVKTAMQFLRDTGSPEEAIKQLDIASKTPPEGPLLDAWAGREDDLEDLLTNNKMAKRWLQSKTTKAPGRALQAAKPTTSGVGKTKIGVHASNTPIEKLDDNRPLYVAQEADPDYVRGNNYEVFADDDAVIQDMMDEDIRLFYYDEVPIESLRKRYPGVDVLRGDNNTTLVLNPSKVELKPTTSDVYSDFLDNLITKERQQMQGQAILDDLLEADISPKSVSGKFWDDVYGKLNPEMQKQFQGMIRALGFQPGDVLAVDRNGNRIIGETWEQIGRFIGDDLGNSVEYLEGSERGYVSLMEWSNRQLFGRNPKLIE